MNLRRKCLFPIAASIMFVIACSRLETPAYWPANGAKFQDITWEIPVADSASVLIEKGGCWVLPQPPDGAHPGTVQIAHQKPAGKPFAGLPGRVDQEVVRGTGTAGREFYRFDQGRVLLLGYEGADSTSLLTVYHPPLVLFPGNLDLFDSTFVNESKPRIWNAAADTFRNDFTTRVRLSVKKRGKVMMDDTTAVQALLCRLSLSQDRTVGFGGTDLIVPDAVTMESMVLAARGVGPVLEWGIRSREKPESASGRTDPMPPGPDRIDRMELYIEATLHRVLND
jgi:hypothetical protein